MKQDKLGETVKRDQSWTLLNNKMYFNYSTTELECGKVYEMTYCNNLGMPCLSPSNITFDIPKKVYDLQEGFIENCLNVYSKMSQNRSIGLLLYGLQGTGKTVTSKIIAQQLNQPIILMGSGLYNQNSGSTSILSSCAALLSKIPQPVTVIFDEFEKNYGDGACILSLLDGTMTSSYKRMFILTTNHIDVNVNLKQRPSRIRYIKKFDTLNEHTIEEILNDCLDDLSNKDKIMEFLSAMDILTIDLVTSLAEELNWTNKTVEEIALDFNFEFREDQKKFFKKYKQSFAERQLNQ